ncbi:hypothetical protein CWI37_0097p0010 [Hamiltosporidium tvaerminnensis]|uniref:Uncharacterized protein n=1 Tax=Hamiltosporidium tvaerminnensis TaxID=1176355 RepID=A0A4Q9LAB0_9MICR|nr:hypothetical protein CWI37_0097p0010 [Hamiltosporidium tvaerminnensis]
MFYSIDEAEILEPYAEKRRDRALLNRMLSNNIKTKNNASLYMKEEPKYPKMKNPYRRGKDGGKEVKKNLKF